jgi:putative tryptophan/tyrosine transport system substrate-binding protein
MKVVTSQSPVGSKQQGIKAMSGKILAWLLTTFLLTTASAQAQQSAIRIPVIGVFLPDTAAAFSTYVEAFLKGLDDLGYVVGQNILIEYRYADGKRDQFPKLATELVLLKVDAILVVGGTLAAAKQATSTIPIVAATAGDLVGSGYVASLAKPAGNITGSTNVDADLSGKRLELLKDAIPKLSRLAFLSFAGNRGDQDELKETRAAAQSLRVQIQPLEVKDRSEFQSAFGAMREERAEAFIITNNSFNFAHRRLVFELAAKYRLPSMCGRDAFVEHGCLISYAASRRDAFRRAAYFVDKILKGTKPADLPVQQPTKFELVINLKTAKQIGLTIPPNVLARADRVIR